MIQNRHPGFSGTIRGNGHNGVSPTYGDITGSRPYSVCNWWSPCPEARSTMTRRPAASRQARQLRKLRPKLYPEWFAWRSVSKWYVRAGSFRSPSPARCTIVLLTDLCFTCGGCMPLAFPSNAACSTQASPPSVDTRGVGFRWRSPADPQQVDQTV